MKMVKSLLLGSAAGLVAIAGAQAADLPVKAKPVQYVKICSLYGAGFFYIPGTDTCIKIGGYVRAEVDVNAGPSFSVLHGDRDTRAFNWTAMRARGVASFDVRSQTEYGTLRSYMRIGEQATNNGKGSGIGSYSNRIFIQWAGFTAGLANSFYGLFTYARYSNQANVITSDVGGGGIITFAYTAQFGNGFSASVAIEEPSTRRTSIMDASGAGNGGYGGRRGPDVVGNLRVDQAWGSAMVMAAAHHVYGAAAGDEIGWAAGGGLLLNLPWAKGDNFSVQASYARGALDYVLAGFAGTTTDSMNGTTFAYTNTYDGVWTGTSMELTDGWSVGAGAVHHWNSMWQTSLYGGYGEVNYNSTATAAMFAGGNPDFSFAQIGSRTVWTPVKNLALSVDIMYNHVGTANVSCTTTACTNQAANSGDVGWVAGIFRAQRNFWP